MSNVSALSVQVSSRTRKRVAIASAAVLVLLAAIAIDTKVVKIGSDEDVQEQVFSPEKYGTKTFPIVQQSIESRAVDAATLAQALADNKAEAVKKYGVGSPMPVIPVSFTGVVGEGRMGTYYVNVDGVPDNVKIRVQTGPAINGTDLRDATGDIKFGDFKNQIEYQNAGAAINDAMKEGVLKNIDNADLAGRTVEITGAFRLLNPKNWLVTPVRMEVK
ncbi:DUF2291 family protein [Pokkaliibacter sp. CJK22405]|uniref:DUF2291 family protein n=1 Tax=Pokkaliibacter sp. CJK22405 TaxID=3384615 RepID=UPI003984C81D